MAFLNQIFSNSPSTMKLQAFILNGSNLSKESNSLSFAKILPEGLNVLLLKGHSGSKALSKLLVTAN